MFEINNDFALKDGGFSNAFNSVDMPRHRWYYYKEGFSPYIVEKAIEATGIKRDELIIDPFNGSGTTTLTASILGYNSVGIEVNPFTAFLSDTKNKTALISDFDKWTDKIFIAVEKGSLSPLVGFSTFSEKDNLEKWLFNRTVLNSFEGGWSATQEIPSYNLRNLFRLGLISSAMQNCNATKDGKCLRYRSSWRTYLFDKASFLTALLNNIKIIKEDLINTSVNGKTRIIAGDSRELIGTPIVDGFKLCITSPPYLNTFDYTDIYRPELFLGKFVSNNDELYNLRLQTVRSHIQAKWPLPTSNDFGIIYENAVKHVNDNKDKLMDKSIPIMIQAYFEDMYNMLRTLRLKAAKNAQVWIVVSNSAYADYEIPVDLIIGDIASKAGWYLKDIGVLRYLQKRKTKHSSKINSLRESVIILSASRIL